MVKKGDKRKLPWQPYSKSYTQQRRLGSEQVVQHAWELPCLKAPQGGEGIRQQWLRAKAKPRDVPIGPSLALALAAGPLQQWEQQVQLWEQLVVEGWGSIRQPLLLAGKLMQSLDGRVSHVSLATKHSLCVLAKAVPPTGWYMEPQGYIRHSFSRQLVHRQVCEAFWGPPPTTEVTAHRQAAVPAGGRVLRVRPEREVQIEGELLALHLCGVPNCLNPMHLCWGSSSANMLMREWHSRVGRGLMYYKHTHIGIEPPSYYELTRE